jgi:hypothetical protein
MQRLRYRTHWLGRETRNDACTLAIVQLWMQTLPGNRSTELAHEGRHAP